MTSSDFLILHGWCGSSANHWQSWLASNLLQQGFKTRFPSLPNANWPNLQLWLQELENVWNEFEDPRRLTIVCHSLAVVLWLHFAKRKKKFLADRVILVAPPGPACDLKELHQFFPAPLSTELITRSCNSTLLICTSADPFCPENAADFYGSQLNIETKVLPDSAAHINDDSGYGPWPLILDICTKNHSNR